MELGKSQKKTDINDLIFINGWLNMLICGDVFKIEAEYDLKRAIFNDFRERNPIAVIQRIRKHIL